MRLETLFSQDQQNEVSKRLAQPRQELLLTRSLAISAPQLFKAGRGHAIALIFEADLESGRPDALALTYSPVRLRSFFRSRPRLKSRNAALELSRSYLEGSSDWSQGGWSSKAVEIAAEMVRDSVAVEAKMSDWGRALKQATSFGVVAERTAILMPVNRAETLARREDFPPGIGLIGQQAELAQWIRPSERRAPGLAARLWMTELLARSVERGVAYSPSEARNALKAL